MVLIKLVLYSYVYYTQLLIPDIYRNSYSAGRTIRGPRAERGALCHRTWGEVRTAVIDAVPAPHRYLSDVGVNTDSISDLTSQKHKAVNKHKAGSPGYCTNSATLPAPHG